MGGVGGSVVGGLGETAVTTGCVVGGVVGVGGAVVAGAWVVAGPLSAGDPGIGGGGGGVTVGTKIGTVVAGAIVEDGDGPDDPGGIGGTVVAGVPVPVPSAPESGIRNVSPTKMRFGLAMRLSSANSSTVTP